MEEYDIIVVGGGVGGVCAAIAAARLNCRTLLIEQRPRLGGTAVYSPVALICKFRDNDGRVINNGIHRELFPEAYNNSGLYFDEEKVPVYDGEILEKRICTLTRNLPTLEVWTSTQVVEGESKNGRLLRVRTTGKFEGWISATVFLDGTADGNLCVMTGCNYEQGREVDGRPQSATTTFICSGIESSKLQNPDLSTWGSHFSMRSELDKYYIEAKKAGKTSNNRVGVLCFPMPDGKRLLFNSTAVLDVNPTDSDSLTHGTAEGEKQVHELFEILHEHPAFEHAILEKCSDILGIRESRRIVGEYKLTADDCLNARKFDDMVAACAYEIDIHDPEGKKILTWSTFLTQDIIIFHIGVLFQRGLTMCSYAQGV